jgi:hypothetical protein
LIAYWKCMGSQNASPQYQPWSSQMRRWYRFTDDEHRPRYSSADDTSIAIPNACVLQSFDPPPDVPAGVAVDAVLDVRLQVLVLDVTVDVVVEVGRPSTLVGDHRGRVTPQLAVEANGVRLAGVGGGPPQRDRMRGVRTRLAEPVDDLRVARRPRRVVVVLVPPAEPRVVPRDDRRDDQRRDQHDDACS